MKEVLSPTRKAMLTLESETYDPTEPFWKVVKINQALHLTKAKTLSAAEQLVETERNSAIDKLGREIKNHVLDSAHYEALQDYVMPVTVETTTDELPNITQEDVAELRQQENWLDNDIFQPDNHEQACERCVPQARGYPGWSGGLYLNSGSHALFGGSWR